MSCPVYEDGSTVMHIEKAEVLRLRAIEAAAHRTIQLLTARATVALPPSAMMLAYEIAFDELTAGLHKSPARADRNEGEK